MKKKILFNGLGNRGWIGGLYYIKNIIFSCLQSTAIMENYELVVLIDPEHADIFDCFCGKDGADTYRKKAAPGRAEAGQGAGENRQQADGRAGDTGVRVIVYDADSKWKLALYEMNLIWLHGVAYCYALELNKIGRLFRKRGIYWIPDFQHRTLPEFFQPAELERKIENDQNMAMSGNPMVLSSQDAKNDLDRFYPKHTCQVSVVHFVSYIEPELRRVTPELMRHVRETFGLAKKYIYLPNQFWKHKNHIVAVRAIEQLRKRNELLNYDFVFTGNLEDYRNPDYIGQLKAIMEAAEVKDCIRLLGFVERTEQLCIMKQAEFIVQPSLCEGWGTVLEDAKVLDKTVLLSDIPVHREQKNEKCVLFDPHNPEELADLIVAQSRAERDEDMERGIARMYREAREYARSLEKVFGVSRCSKTDGNEEER